MWITYVPNNAYTIVTVTDESSLPKNLMLSFNHNLYIKFTHMPSLSWPDQNSGQERLAHNGTLKKFQPSSQTFANNFEKFSNYLWTLLCVETNGGLRTASWVVLWTNSWSSSQTMHICS